MPSVEYDYKDLTSLIGEGFTLEELSEWISMMGVGLEEINEEKLVIEIFPNRPDMLSIEGFARALNGFLSKTKGLPQYEVAESDIKIISDRSVDTVRPYCTGAIVKDILLDDYSVKSLMQIQEKLHLTHGRHRSKVAIGVHDLDKIIPPFTYKAVNPDSVGFIPLDMDEELSMREILVKHPKGKDYAWTLEGFDKWPLFIDSNNNVLSFPPIINGELTAMYSLSLRVRASWRWIKH